MALYQVLHHEFCRASGFTVHLIQGVLEGALRNTRLRIHVKMSRCVCVCVDSLAQRAVPTTASTCARSTFPLDSNAHDTAPDTVHGTVKSLLAP